MLVKFLARGTGSARDAADYLLGERDAAGKPREGVEVLRGDPNQVAAVADTLPFEHKYTSGVIAWAPEDEPTDEQIGAVLDAFEETAWRDWSSTAMHGRRCCTASADATGVPPGGLAFPRRARARARDRAPDRCHPPPQLVGRRLRGQDDPVARRAREERYEHRTPVTAEALAALEEAQRRNPGNGDAPVLPASRDASRCAGRSPVRYWWNRAEELRGWDASVGAVGTR